MFIMVWLLIVSESGNRNDFTHVLERFETAAECQRVAQALPEPRYSYRPKTVCVQAKVLVAK